ncbi:MAG TPA: hypothetical protein VKU01_19120 [Bryobacteraceae bacterium]|nr:hypothetical protein [Bryobacteraceae bacterium]
MPGLEPYAEALGIRTRNIYSGIRALLSLPASGDVGAVSNLNQASVHYFNFYLGIDDLIEGGVSYSKKYSAGFQQGSWRQFLNPGQPSAASSVHFGQKVQLELTTNAQKQVSLTLGGQIVGSYSGIGAGHVKMVIAVADAVPHGHAAQVWFSLVAFSQVKLRAAGATDWHDAGAADFQAADHLFPHGRPGVMRQGGGLLSASIAQPG